ncbi:MAG: hypothetical protein FWD69_16095 [Polyangiaceae bacterium]|nr:hypothetical protein [Polyangiaceae bacterium]
MQCDSFAARRGAGTWPSGALLRDKGRSSIRGTSQMPLHWSSLEVNLDLGKRPGVVGFWGVA